MQILLMFMRICHADKQKTALFQTDLCVISASHVAVLLRKMHHFLPVKKRCLNFANNVTAPLRALQDFRI